MIRFTKEQMETLERYEYRLGTAYRAKWCSAMQKRDYDTVWQLWKDASGESLERNANCGGCVLRLMSRVGAAYFAQREDEERVRLAKVKATAKRSVRIKAGR